LFKFAEKKMGPRWMDSESHPQETRALNAVTGDEASGPERGGGHGLSGAQGQGDVVDASLMGITLFKKIQSSFANSL
jgi:hypothetical protein